jgi:hypothetical protein
MKKIITIILFCAFVLLAKTQKSSIERSITEIQIGTVGLL